MVKILKQYTDLKIEIKELEKELIRIRQKEIELVHDSVIRSKPTFPYNEQIINIMGKDEKEYQEKNKKIQAIYEILKERKIKCMDLVIQIEQYISKIPDSQLRLIFRLRYIQDLTWQAIAFRIGKHDESYPRWKHAKYIEELNKREEEIH